jgi:hypothetical protein
MTHVPLNWPPDRPEFVTPVMKKPVIEKPLAHEKLTGFVVNNRTTNNGTNLRDLISLSIALNYFGGTGVDKNGRTPLTRLRKLSSPGCESTQPWRTAVSNVVLERRSDVLANGDPSTPSR